MNSSSRISDLRNDCYSIYNTNIYFRQSYDYTQECCMKKLSRIGYFPQINILKTYNKIYINDFNMEFRDILEGICKEIGIAVNNIKFNVFDDPPDAVVEVYANNLDSLSEDAITAKLSLLTTYESTEDYK